MHEMRSSIVRTLMGFGESVANLFISAEIAETVQKMLLFVISIDTRLEKITKNGFFCRK